MKKDFIFNSDSFVDQVQWVGKSIDMNSAVFRKNNGMIYSNELYKCTRMLVSNKIKNIGMSTKEKVRFIMNDFIRNIWVEKFLQNENFTVQKIGYEICDVSTNFVCFIDAIVRIAEVPFVFLFRYVSKKELEKINQTGILKRDVIDITSCLRLSNTSDGVVVYQHRNSSSFHVKISDDVYNLIEAKCKKINGFIMRKQVPQLCVAYDKKRCFANCQ